MTCPFEAKKILDQKVLIEKPQKSVILMNFQSKLSEKRCHTVETPLKWKLRLFWSFWLWFNFPASSSFFAMTSFIPKNQNFRNFRTIIDQDILYKFLKPSRRWTWLSRSRWMSFCKKISLLKSTNLVEIGKTPLFENVFAIALIFLFIASRIVDLTSLEKPASLSERGYLI